MNSQDPSFLHFPDFTALTYPVPQRPVCSFNKRMVVIGGGAICAAFLPVVEKLVQIDWKKVTIIDIVDIKDKYSTYASRGIQFAIENIDKNNYQKVLAKYVSKGDMLVELAYNLKTLDLLSWCQTNGVMYFNTAMYDWSTVDEHSFENSESSFLSAIFHQMLQIREMNDKKKNGTTAILCHGANPGFVNHLVKQGLTDLTRQLIHDFPNDPETPELKKALAEKNYPKIAQLSGIKIVQISEYDSQKTTLKKEKNMFISSWNIPSFCEEAAAVAAFPYGTHETKAPNGTKFDNFRGNRIANLPTRAMNTLAKSWLPGIGEFYGGAPHHEETITMADFMTVRNKKGEVEYAPTVWFVYRPMDVACESLKEFEQLNYKVPDRKVIARDDIYDGRDSLGLFLLGHKLKGWWVGSLLSIQETRATGAKHINATTLQVGASLAAAVCWAVQNPSAGIHLPETLPSEEILHYMKPWMGPWVSMPVNWSPNGEANPTADAWTFMNFLHPSGSIDGLFEKPVSRSPRAKL